MLRYAARDETEFQGTGTSSVVALTIRNTADTDVTTTTGITINQLIQKYGLLVPQIVNVATPSPSR